MGRYHLPPEWVDFGAYWSRDGRLHLGEWRKGFTVHELRALFFECQQVRSLKAEARYLKSQLETAEAAQERLERRCEWFRVQLTLESRLGPILQRYGSL